jgi:hypothetical protein
MNRRSFLYCALAGALSALAIGPTKPAAASHADEVSDAHAAGYLRGYDVGTMRVESRKGYGAVITNAGDASNEYRLRVTNAPSDQMRAWVFGNDPTTLHLGAGTFGADEVNQWMRESGATQIFGPAAGRTTIQGPGTLAVTDAVGIHYQPAPPTFEAG